MYSLVSFFQSQRPVVVILETVARATGVTSFFLNSPRPSGSLFVHLILSYSVTSYLIEGFFIGGSPRCGPPVGPRPGRRHRTPRRPRPPSRRPGPSPCF